MKSFQFLKAYIDTMACGNVWVLEMVMSRVLHVDDVWFPSKSMWLANWPSATWPAVGFLFDVVLSAAASCCCLIPLFKTHKCSFPVCSCSTNQFQRSFLLNFSKFPEKLRQIVEGVFSLCWKPVSFCCSLRDIDIAFPWSAEFSQKTQSHTKQQPAAVTTKASTHQQHPTTSVT